MPDLLPFKIVTEEIKQKFLSKIIKLDSGCWTLAYKDTQGYSRFTTKKSTTVTGHKASYQIFKGIEGLAYMCVLHKCDNSCCVNPDHLYLGTPKQNTDDMFNRNRDAISILTKEQVKEIQVDYSKGNITQKALGIKYNVGQSCISRVVTKARWSQYI